MKNIKKYLIISFIIVITISLTILKIWLNNHENDIEPIKKDNISLEKKGNTNEKEKHLEKISVDIKGAVTNPGVYEINDEGKVIDIINMAGGLKDNADTSLINLARKVEDEMVIIIYTNEEIKEATKNNTSIIKPIDTVCKCPEIKNDACLNTSKTKESNTKTAKESTTTNNKETTTKETSKDNNNESNSELVNINTASKEELTKVNGIGDSKAQAIIDYRNNIGKFTSIEDIKKVTGIGEALYNKVKDYITV